MTPFLIKRTPCVKLTHLRTLYYDDNDEYEPLDTILDDEYDVPPTKSGKPINNRMGTLNRVQGMVNRHRNAGRIK